MQQFSYIKTVFNDLLANANLGAHADKQPAF